MTKLGLIVVTIAMFLSIATREAWAQASRASVNQNPDWLSKPDGQMLQKAYPAIAAAIGIEGVATIRCDVTSAGRLSNCEVKNESPIGLGFGNAAISLAQTFQMWPKMMNGKPVEGGHVQIPIRFKPEPLPELQPGTSSAHDNSETPSAHILALSEKFILSLPFGDRGDERFERELQELANRETPGLDPALRDDGLAALRLGYRAMVDEIHKYMAVLIAREFSEAELIELNTKKITEINPAYLERAIHALEKLNDLGVNADPTASKTISDYYCSRHPCSPTQVAIAK